MVTVAAVIFPKVEMFCNQALRKTGDNFCRQQNTFQVTKPQKCEDLIMWSLTWKQLSNFITVSKSLL